MTPHRTVVHETLVAADAIGNQATRMYWARDDAILRTYLFHDKMTKRGLSFPDPDDIAEDAELNAVCDARAGQSSVVVARGHRMTVRPL